MKNKRPVSFEEHKVIGRKLYRLNDFIKQLACVNSGAGSVNSKEVKLCCKIDDLLSELRSEMEEVMYRNHREASKAHKPPADVRLCVENSGFTYIYYPGDAKGWDSVNRFKEAA